VSACPTTLSAPDRQRFPIVALGQRNQSIELVLSFENGFERQARLNREPVAQIKRIGRTTFRTLMAVRTESQIVAQSTLNCGGRVSVPLKFQREANCFPYKPHAA